MNVAALMNTLTTRCRTLPVVILYVTEGCNLRCITCSYRNPMPGELSLAEIRELAVALRSFGLRHIVYSGGEPLMRRDFPAICAAFQSEGVQQSLLTNGLLLEKRLPEIGEFLSEIIVSLDGPTSPVHDGIRGVESFDRILAGVRSAVRLRPGTSVAIRTVVQKRNFRLMREMVRLATTLDVDRISFLAADLYSDSFGRDTNVPRTPDKEISLTAQETKEFRAVLEALNREFPDEFRAGFVSESYDRLLHIASYYEAVAGLGPFPLNRCNAPMVSAVISSTGAVHPCFFLPAYANVRKGEPAGFLNNESIRRTRSDVRNMNLDRCKTCVCMLYVSPLKALHGSF